MNKFDKMKKNIQQIICKSGYGSHLIENDILKPHEVQSLLYELTSLVEELYKDNEVMKEKIRKLEDPHLKYE